MNQPLGIYIHIPFCAARCFYCHFTIDLGRGAIQERYVDAVVREIRRSPELHEPSFSRTVDSIYIGGGTPSWIEAKGIKEILSEIHNRFEVHPAAEITIEVNPDSLDHEKASLYRAIGINRVSVGAQSFHDDELKRLGRTHSSGDVHETLQMLRSSGFNDISIDLMAALPQQSLQSWKNNWKFIEEIRPEHISLYLFDLDDESALGRRVLASHDRTSTVLARGENTIPSDKRPIVLPSEEETVEIYNEAVSELRRQGYLHYEISNFAALQKAEPGPAASFISRHNLKYWNLQPYLGFGCAAHSFIYPSRWHNENSAESYIRGIEGGESVRREAETISAARLTEDAFIFGLRQIAGIRYDTLSEMLGNDARQLFRRIIDPLIQEGWLLESQNTLRLAPQALLVSNEIFQQFLGANESD
ncbi:MAG: radical SAM family heme chaperone HemW [Acidobacteriia bacterium]|nr:radical SAM family heme chaperone HemW [Terriglobia bacterium]